jgi:hypothetical protein
MTKGLRYIVLRLIVGIFVASALVSCSNERRLANGKPLRNLNANQVIAGYVESEFQWDWIGMKINVAVESPEGNQSFKATVRMAQDSAIWMSISPALGVEVARIMLSPDSVQFFSKIPGNKFYYQGNYDALGEWADSPLSFADVQAILGGKPMGFDKENGKYIARTDDARYALIGKYKRQVKRVIGVNDNALSPEDSLNIQLPTRRYERLRNRTDDEDLLIQRHWFDGLTFDPLQDQFNDLYYQRSLTLNRSEFEDTDNGRFPREFDVLIQTLDGDLRLHWNISRIRFGRAYDFPFTIPENYEQRTGF